MYIGVAVSPELRKILPIKKCIILDTLYIYFSFALYTIIIIIIIIIISVCQSIECGGNSKTATRY